MIWLNNDGEVVIRTNIQKENIDQLVAMRKSVLELLSSQDNEFHDRDSNYWAFQLVNLLDVEPEQICLEKK